MNIGMKVMPIFIGPWTPQWVGQNVVLSEAVWEQSSEEKRLFKRGGTRDMEKIT
jgi:hypothetical protein